MDQVGKPRHEMAPRIAQTTRSKISQHEHAPTQPHFMACEQGPWQPQPLRRCVQATPAGQPQLCQLTGVLVQAPAPAAPTAAPRATLMPGTRGRATI